MPNDNRDNSRDDDNAPTHRWPGAEGAGANGRGAEAGDVYSADEEDDEPRAAGGASGRWISSGGVLVWEEPETASEQTLSEAERASADLPYWAADELELPAGAPVGARVRAVRAWLLARRQAENEALGMLLLEQRRMQPAEEETHLARRGAREESPLELALLEHQAAADEYELLFEALAEVETHSGPQRLLVEFYLAVSDRLAELANAPEAPADFAPALRVDVEGQARQRPTRRSAAEWQGRASAVTQARRRIERMTAPETEE